MKIDSSIAAIVSGEASGLSLASVESIARRWRQGRHL